MKLHIHHWKAEGLRLRRQPLTWWALGSLCLVLLVTAVFAGHDARAWRLSAEQYSALWHERLEAAVQRLHAMPSGPARVTATYQLGRSDLASTRMPVAAGLGLGLGVQRLDVLPVRLKASLDSPHVQARDPGPLRNPLLVEAGLPGVPAMVALVLPLVALVLCAGLRQEDQEQGRAGLLRVQSTQGLAPLWVAALGWRLLVLWVAACAATLPCLLLDPGATAAVGLQWAGALALFCAVWVVLGGLLSCAPVSGAVAMLAALGLWVALSFGVPAGLAMAAHAQAPLPSRLVSIVAIRDAQHASEDNEQGLAEAWYDEHPEVPAQLPAVWPASFVVRVLDQDLALEPMARAFRERRAQQAALLSRWSWLSPGLALVLHGERLAGTDAEAHASYLAAVQAYEQAWRDALVPHVMDGRGMDAEQLRQLPRFTGPVLR